MIEPSSIGSQLPINAEKDTGNIFPTTDEKQDGILFKDDDIFIKKIFETDPGKAFELLFNKYYGSLCSHATRFVYSKQKAEDLVTDVFVLFWHNKLFTNVKRTYRSYFFTAVRNKCYTYLKWELKKEWPEEAKDIQVESLHPTPVEILQASDLHLKIEQTVKSLPTRQQQVFIMSRFEGKKNSEIATALNLSLKTVEMHISKALATFRKALREQF